MGAVSQRLAGLKPRPTYYCRAEALPHVRPKNGGADAPPYVRSRGQGIAIKPAVTSRGMITATSASPAMTPDARGTE